MVRNFKEFKKGNWYIYTGSERGDLWNNKGMMDFVLDHKPVQYLCALKPVSAEFINTMWNWVDGFDNWIEIKDPNKIHQAEKGEYLYDKNDNSVSIADRNYYKCSGHPYYVLTNPPLDSYNCSMIEEKEQEEISTIIFVKRTKVKELLI